MRAIQWLRSRWGLATVGITAVGLVILWPIPTGTMPLSADHPVHLARIAMWADALQHGHLRGWSPIWFFGTPIGELYPIGGDALIVAIRAVTFGAIGWERAYAWGLCLVFLAQGWALLRVAKVCDLGVVCGVIAAAAVLLDPGAYREGGWDYTMTYGVWPQALSTAGTWWGLGEVLAAAKARDLATARRHIAWGGVAWGGALLAHPMALAGIAVGGVVAFAAGGWRGAEHRTRFLTRGGLVVGLGVGLSAAWLLPMLAHRSYMASYGWMWLPLRRMAAQVLDGHWAQHMAPGLGYAIAAGMIIVAIAGRRPARALVAYAAVLWLLTSRDVLWWFRLDLLSEGFTHIQYQRFLVAAKPGLFLAAGLGISTAARVGLQAWNRRARWAQLGLCVGAMAVAVGLTGWAGIGMIDTAKTRSVGEIQTHRDAKDVSFDADVAALHAWAADVAPEGSPPFRATVRARRNLHWFMDLPAHSDLPVYKQGFTPGDNFVHKPEAAHPKVLDALRVRYVIDTGRRGPGQEVARFGRIRVRERPGWDRSIASTDGGASIEVVEDDPGAGRVRVRVSGSTEGEILRFAIAGHPRWVLTRDGAAVPWYEVPVHGNGPTATADDRRGGLLRGGKALGDDGTEPTLIASGARDGEYLLEYDHWRWFDVLGLVLSGLSLVTCVAVGASRWANRVEPRLRALEGGVGKLTRPSTLAVVGLGLLILGGIRWSRGHDAEGLRAVGRLDEAQVSGAWAGLLKTDMLIRPAVLVRRRGKRPAIIEFSAVRPGPRLTGWIALDDDAAQVKRKGAHHVRIETRSVGTGAWEMLEDRAIPHKPGRNFIDLPLRTSGPVDLRVIVTTTGKSPPPVGFDLEFAAEGEP